MSKHEAAEMRWLRAVAEAAQETLDEAWEIHETRPWPLKYQAPYGALAKLGLLLDARPAGRA
jgi:hypothetical protein